MTTAIKAIDRSEIYERYQNKWIAVTDDDKLITVGSTLDNVLEKAKEKGFLNPVTAKIPDLKYEFIL